MNNQTPNSQNNSVFRFILLLVLIGFAFLLFFLNQTRKKTEEEQNFVSTTIPTPVVLKMGSFNLKPATGVASGVVDETLDLDVVASSDDKLIVGYDVILKFAEGEVDIVSAESLLVDFTLYPIKKSDHYIVTGIKKLGSQEPSMFDSIPILRLSVVPKRAGKLILTVVDKLDLEKSQMVDEKTTILAPQVGQITLEIK